MRRTGLIGGLMISLLTVTPLAAMQSQGKGHEKANHGNGPGKNGGKKDEKADAIAKGRDKIAAKVDKPSQNRSASSELRIRREEHATPAVARARGQHAEEFGGEVASRGFRTFVVSPKNGERLAGRAVSRAMSRGLSDDDFVISPVGNNVYILNRSGALLVNLNEDFDVGTWRAVVERDRGKSDSPSFCRSGAGHPVWGRQWCIEKGFGLGDDQGFRWARALDLGDVTFRREVSPNLLDREALLTALGDVVFNRLATHAVTLGLVDPLVGQWIGEPGSRVMLVTAGTRPIAEIVDRNGDNRADLMVVAVRP